MIKYIKRNSIMASLMLLGACMLQACDDNESFDVIGDPNNLAYINIAGKPNNLLTYSVIKTPVGIENNINGKFPVCISRAIGENVTIKVEQDNSLLEAYNAANGTSYLAAPAGLVNINNTTLTVEKGANASIDSISYTANESILSNLEVGKSYLIPLQITTISNSGIQASRNKNCAYLAIGAKYQSVRENSTNMLGSIITNYTGWTYTSTHTTGAIANFWTTSTSSRVDFNTDPATIIFDMKALKKITGVRIYTRGAGSGTSYRLNNAKMALSTDGVSFTDIADLTINQIGYASNYQYICMYKSVEAQYLKLEMDFASTSTSYWSVVTLGVYAE